MTTCIGGTAKILIISEMLTKEDAYFKFRQKWIQIGFSDVFKWLGISPSLGQFLFEDESARYISDNRGRAIKVLEAIARGEISSKRELSSFYESQGWTADAQT